MEYGKTNAFALLTGLDPRLQKGCKYPSRAQKAWWIKECQCSDPVGVIPRVAGIKER